MDDNTYPQEMAPVAEPATCKVRCITDLKPWANVILDGGQLLRPMALDEVVTVPAVEGAMLQKNRHAIIVG